MKSKAKKNNLELNERNVIFKKVILLNKIVLAFENFSTSCFLASIFSKNAFFLNITQLIILK